jgi:hypothetical protein
MIYASRHAFTLEISDYTPEIIESGTEGEIKQG